MVCRRFSLTFFTVLFLLASVSAKPSARYLACESEVSRHEEALSGLALSTEEWLSGRLKQQQMLTRLAHSESALGSYLNLPKPVATQAFAAEQKMLRETRRFVEAKEPDSEGQKALFLKLGGLQESRTKSLLNWRLGQNKALARGGRPSEYLAWEAHWLPLWLEEATLTRKLQLALLSDDETGVKEKKDILRSLLRLRVKGEKVQVGSQLQELQALSQERLTILARTAEQLIRMEKRKSRGALTRVRRLSKKLTRLTQEFQGKRLKQLKQL